MGHIEFKINSSDQLSIYGQSWIPDSKASGLVLLIHGLGEHSGRYDHVAKMLNQAGYIASAFDLRGHGKSEGIRGHTPSYKAYLDDMTVFIEEIENKYPDLPRFLYGHSLGALLILYFAIEREMRFNGLIASGPALRNELETQKFKVALIKLLSRLSPTLSISTGLVTDHLSHDNEVITAYVNDPLVHDRASLSMAKNGLSVINWVFEHAKNIRDPLLIMQGSMDKICFPDSTRDFVQLLSCDVTVKFWDGLYHEIHNEKGWQEVIQYMIDWMNNRIKQIN